MGISPRRSGRSAAVAPSSHSQLSPPSPRKRRNSLQYSNQSPPPRAEQPLTSPAPDDDEEEEDEEEDGSAEITRCVCGSQEYPFPDADVEDTGFMICCEQCNVWQHGPCVGVMSENEAPDVYFCEECRPDLHELGSRNQGHRQSRWIGSSVLQQPSRRKKSSTSVIQGSLKGEQSISPPPSDKDTSTATSKTERKPSPKKRSTMNSRDAAYDYSSMFATATSTTGGDDDTKMDDTGSPPTSRSGDSRSRRRGKRVAEDDEDESPTISTTGGRSHKRRRASSETEDRPESLAEATVSSGNVGRPKNKGRAAVKRSSRDDSEVADGLKTKDDSSDNQHGNTTPLLDAPPTGSRHGKRGGGHGGHGAKRKNQAKSSDRVDSEEPPTPTLRRAPQGLEEMIKPARARIPQARSGLNEMRKRVGAILEYVGRLQADVAPTANQTPSATPVDDPEVIEKPDMDNAPSVIIMEYLTKRCLDFEVKFGKYPGRYG